MTSEQYEAKIEELKLANENQLIFHSNQMWALEREFSALKADYAHLIDSTRVLGKSATIINHLEKQIRIRDAVISSYQEHYSKWGNFYKEYEMKKPQ